jgi:DNA (cytosine-5)-methyltransferase 1
MSVYYNEFDRAKAAWLRHLIEEGVIAHGVVDERSIQSVEPGDLRGFAQCHFFAGVGVWSYALRRAGVPDDRPLWTGSCPCGPFSTAGLQKGFDDPRHLWPEWFRLIGQCRPGLIFGEQVAAADAWLDLVSTDLEALGYAVGSPDLPAAGFGGAHIRQRFEWVADADNAEWWSERAPWHDGFWPATGRLESNGDARERGGDGGLGHASGRGSSKVGSDLRQERSVQKAQRGAEHRPALSRRASRAGGLGLTIPAGLSDAQLGIIRRAGWRPQGGATEQPGDPSRPGADWLFCRDRRWRPVEPGTCPLVDEAPARMGRLRGYGDAIDAEAATQFIAAYFDVSPMTVAA